MGGLTIFCILFVTICVLCALLSRCSTQLPPLTMTSTRPSQNAAPRPSRTPRPLSRAALDPYRRLRRSAVARDHALSRCAARSGPTSLGAAGAIAAAVRRASWGRFPARSAGPRGVSDGCRPEPPPEALAVGDSARAERWRAAAPAHPSSALPAPPQPPRFAPSRPRLGVSHLLARSRTSTTPGGRRTNALPRREGSCRRPGLLLSASRPGGPSPQSPRALPPPRASP